jgi:regulator of sirC expression with transglutaminase-like and TPR domain
VSGDAPREGTPEPAGRAAHEALLRRVQQAGDAPGEIADAALALAALDRPRVALERYRHHLDLLARDVADELRGEAGAAGAARALKDAILGRHGYAGDTLTYDDVQNANLMRVIDRRKGLPVALGILYIHAGRAQGWEVAGLGFPGHFLLRLERDGERLILDPFNGGRVCAAAELRDLLKSTAGVAAELDPSHYAAVSDREILLRLQNNIKLRLLQDRKVAPALAVVERMLILAPDRTALWHEAGALNAHLGNLRAAIAALEAALARGSGEAALHQTALLLQQLKGKLN